jgi:hypothetical protein
MRGDGNIKMIQKNKLTSKKEKIKGPVMDREGNLIVTKTVRFTSSQWEQIEALKSDEFKLATEQALIRLLIDEGLERHGLGYGAEKKAVRK